ncbi:hypothetical protein [Nocardioides sp. URHA0020]|uniref:hypothetical protein n=1 Tax=Nocardioides sp. URHA0020 TaxID=1380392 RepID=UPI0004903B7D|nr:hypothetical protein [Nocardioides sp. URHA0020]
MTDIVPQDIRAAANQMEIAVTAVDANVPTGVGDVASAMPGSTSAGAATTLADTWRTAYQTWVTASTQHVASLRQHADDWVATDQAQAARMERLARGGM